MPRSLIPMGIALGALALGGCDLQHSSAGQDKDVHIALSNNGSSGKVSLDIPAINANLTLPAINLGEHLDMDGIKLPPNSSVRGVDVQGDGDNARDAADDSGRVRLTFVNTARPDAMLAYFRQALSDAGYTLTDPGGGALSGIKGGKRFAFAVQPDGSGSRASIDLTERE